MDDHALHLPQLLGGAAEEIFNIAHRHMRIGALKIDLGFDCIHAGKLARHAHVYFTHAGVRLRFRLVHRIGNSLVQGVRLVPLPIGKAGIGREARADNIAALAAAGFRPKGDNLAGAEINGRYSDLHYNPHPPSVAALTPPRARMANCRMRPCH